MMHVEGQAMGLQCWGAIKLQKWLLGPGPTVGTLWAGLVAGQVGVLRLQPWANRCNRSGSVHAAQPGGMRQQILHNLK